jgi:hypothetical protein
MTVIRGAVALALLAVLSWSGGAVGQHRSASADSGRTRCGPTGVRNDCHTERPLPRPPRPPRRFDAPHPTVHAPYAPHPTVEAPYAEPHPTVIAPHPTVIAPGPTAGAPHPTVIAPGPTAGAPRPTVNAPLRQPGETTEAPLTPVRAYLRAQDIPPHGAGAYGLVVFQSKRTQANEKKLEMVCKSFVAFFPVGKTSIVPIQNQMITVWPLDSPDAEEAKADNCDFDLNHYDLNAAEAAIKDARIQHASFDGEGPYLVGWSPSNTRGIPDKLVLVIDMSADNSQELIDQKFLFWKNKIVESPDLWRSGWSIEGLRVAIKTFSDQYGKDMLESIKLIGAEKE